MRLEMFYHFIYMRNIFSKISFLKSIKNHICFSAHFSEIFLSKKERSHCFYKMFLSFVLAKNIGNIFGIL